ncbi:MAG: fumarylacetoacetate hydrolase family protein [Thiolinea sp.]
MMHYVITPPVQPSVAVAGSHDRFPVRRIFCIGRNYAAHAREMGKDPDREPPFFFTKPADAVVDDQATVAYPPLTENFHYEAELVVAIGKAATRVSEPQALEHVWGYAIGNDLTRRDVCSCRPVTRVVPGTAARLSTTPVSVVRCIRSVRSAIWHPGISA